MKRYLLLLVVSSGFFFPVSSLASTPAGEASYEWELVDVGDVRPPARDYACLVAAPNGEGVFMLGGRAHNEVSGGMTIKLRDLWRWDGESWELLDEGEYGPAQCQGSNAVFDERRNRLVVIAPNLETEFMEHWEWNGSAWSMRDISMPLRDVHLVVYDPFEERLLLYGGHGLLHDVLREEEECQNDGERESPDDDEGTHGCWRDMWEYVDGEWRRISTTCDRSAPQCTWLGDGYFDLERRAMRVIPMPDSRRTSIFERTDEGWTRLESSELIDVHVGVRGVYNTDTKEYLIYRVQWGAFAEEGPRLFAFSDRWTPLTTTGPPPKGEILPALTHIPNSEDVLLFGGRWEPRAHGEPDSRDTLSNDLWILRRSGANANAEIDGCYNCATMNGPGALWVWSVLVLFLAAARRRMIIVGAHLIQ